MRQADSSTVFRADQLIPHRPPLLLIDSVGFENGVATAYTEVKPGWVVLDRSGRLSGAAFFEIMAQGYAAVQAMLAGPDNGLTEARDALGFLVGVKNLQLSGTAGPGDKLRITIGEQNSIGPFHVFDAFVRSGNAAANDFQLASGQIKVFLTGKDALQAGLDAR